MSEPVEEEPDTWDPNPPENNDRGLGRTLYGKDHRRSILGSTNYLDDRQIGDDEPTSGAFDEARHEFGNYVSVKQWMGDTADKYDTTIPEYTRYLGPNYVQDRRDFIHGIRMREIRDVNQQLDLLRRNTGN